MIPMDETYDVIIVGGGITGASLLYAISEYSDIKNVLLLEKYGGLALLNSNSRNNAQTLHFGDIETNYSKETARRTKEAAELVLRYASRIPAKNRGRIIQQVQKMVLGVGDFELGIMDGVYSNIKPLFPGLKRIGRRELSRIEPNVVKGRNPEEKIAALLSDKGYMVDFGRLTASFAENAKKNRKTRIEMRFNSKVLRVKKSGEGFDLFTREKRYSARFVVFATGAYSLYFAKTMGYDKNLSVLSVAGNFYYSKKVLNGKVYRVQIGGIPFAAVHGDPEITNASVTRFGPTVSLPFALEKGRGGTFWDYMRTFDFDFATLASLKNVLFNKDIERILKKNAAYDFPIIGKGKFLKNEAAKIVPALKNRDLWLAKGIGGIRPQIIDERKRFLVVGEAKLKEEGLIFNVTPSPGATSCLSSAVEDLRIITKHLGREFYEEKFGKELGSAEHALRHV